MSSISGVSSSGHRVKPNMAAMEALSYICFSPPTQSYMFTCYVKTMQGDWKQGLRASMIWLPYLASLFAQSVTGSSHSIYIYIYIWSSLTGGPFERQIWSKSTICPTVNKHCYKVGRTMVTLMEKGEKCGSGYLAVGNLKGRPLETQLHTYTVYMVKHYPYTNLLHIKNEKVVTHMVASCNESINPISRWVCTACSQLFNKSVTVNC